MEISRIFREHVEAGWGLLRPLDHPRDLDHLQGLQHLQSGNVPRAKRLLRATDRIKFADAKAALELFDELDAALRGFVFDEADDLG